MASVPAVYREGQWYVQSTEDFTSGGMKFKVTTTSGTNDIDLSKLNLTNTGGCVPGQEYTLQGHKFWLPAPGYHDQRIDYLRTIMDFAGTSDVKQGVPPKKKRGKCVTYGGKMQGYSMGEYNLYEVAAIELPSKKGDFEGEGAKSLTFGTDKNPIQLIVAPNSDAAVVRASKMINEEYAVERLKVYVRPFVESES